MTTTKTKCDTKQTETCDARYVLKVWLYGMSVLVLLSGLGSVIAAVSWKKDMEYTDKDLSTRLDKVERSQAKIDSIYKWVMPK